MAYACCQTDPNGVTGKINFFRDGPISKGLDELNSTIPCASCVEVNGSVAGREIAFYSVIFITNRLIL